jgi:hypothetical protein
MEAQSVELLADPERDVDDATERCARPGIKIHDRVVGVAHGLNAGVPGIDRDGPELYDVQQRRQIPGDEAILRLQSFVRDGLDAHASRRVFG